MCGNRHSVVSVNNNWSSQSVCLPVSRRTHTHIHSVSQYYYFASAAVAVDSRHITASSSALWCSFSPPSNFVNGHVSTVWFMVCRWPQSQEGDWARPHLWDCKLAWYGPWPVWKRFIRHRVWWGRSKPGCWIVGSVTIVWLTTVTCLYRWLCFWCRRQLSLCASVRTSDSLKTFRDVMISTDSAIVVCVSVSCLTSHTVYMQQGRGLWCVTV